MTQRARRSRGALTRRRVVETALSLVDEHGLDALSMPRLASELGCGVMTLYGHVGDKGDLLDAVVARVLDEVPPPAAGVSGWREPVLGWARGLRAALVRHHGVVPLLVRCELSSPAVLDQLDSALASLRAAGFDDETAVRGLHALVIYVLGFVQWEVPRVRQQSRAAYARRWRRDVAGLPEERTALRDTVDLLTTVADDAQFEFGLGRLADALAGA